MATKVIEVNGIKLEVDDRYCKVIEKFNIGDNVKVLVKKYSDAYESYAGVIVGFDNFSILPTIIVAYLDISYGSDAGIKMISINAKSKDVEICQAGEYTAPFEKERVTDLMDRAILKKEEELQDLRHKRDFFLKNFKKYFELPVDNTND